MLEVVRRKVGVVLAERGQDRVRFGLGIAIGETPISGSACAADQQVDAEAGIGARRSAKIVNIVANDPYRPLLTEAAPCNDPDYFQ